MAPNFHAWHHLAYREHVWLQVATKAQDEIARKQTNR